MMLVLLVLVLLIRRIGFCCCIYEVIVFKVCIVCLVFVKRWVDKGFFVFGWIERLVFFICKCDIFIWMEGLLSEE